MSVFGNDLDRLDDDVVLGVPAQYVPLEHEYRPLRAPAVTDQLTGWDTGPLELETERGTLAPVALGLAGVAAALCLLPVLNALAALLAVAALAVGLVAVRQAGSNDRHQLSLAATAVALAVVAGLGAAGSMVSYADSDAPLESRAR